MRGLVSRPLVLVLLLCGHIIGGCTLEGRQQARPRAPSPSPPAEPFPSTGTVIAEVLFAPPPGAAPFVELFNSSAAPVEVGTMLLRIGEQHLPLGHVTAPLAPNARLLVMFDGGDRAENGILHAPKSISLPDKSGVVELLNYMSRPIDRVAWGQQPAAVAFGNGFPGEDPPSRGSTIGRPPTANRPSVFTEWVVYGPKDATPGAANPVPGVPLSDLAPMSGTIFSDASVSLSWFPATGVSQYRVQIDTDPSFSAPRVDRVVDEPRVEARLDPGPYVWRVQSVVAGTPAPFSPPASFRVDPGAGVAGLWRAMSGWLAATLGLGPATGNGIRMSASPAIPNSPVSRAATTGAFLQSRPVRLGVPLLLQRKDSLMLQLENPNPMGPHAWNRGHSIDGTRNDKADTWNCALANVAMVNRYYGGTLTQDRIGYEMLSRNVLNYHALYTRADGTVEPDMANLLREIEPGPEWDLSYGNGINGAKLTTALAYALNGLPRVQAPVSSLDEMWTLLTTEIDAKRPVIGGYGNHTFTIEGYQVFPGTRIIFVNDPLWDEGQQPVDLDAIPGTVWRKLAWWLMPTGSVTAEQQEPGVTIDSDGDQVRDFDETERFFTDPHKRDSDDDGVDDLQDIASTVFEAEHGLGYGATHVVGGRGRDFDQDRLPNERDPDSDDAGCKDGEEDVNNSGMHERPESGNFDDTDDFCNGADGVIKYTTVTSADFRDSPDPNRRVRVFSAETARITFKLKRDPTREVIPGAQGFVIDLGARGQLVDDGSTFRAETSGQIVINAAPECTMYAREWSSGSGLFDRDGRSVGGSRSGRTLGVGANGDTTGFSSANLCGTVGGGPIEGSWAMPECTGTLDGSSPNVFLFDCRAPSYTMPDTRILLWTVYGHIRAR